MEYTGKEIDNYLESQLDHQLTVLYTVPQNGFVERGNLILMQIASWLLKDGGLPNSFWGKQSVPQRTPKISSQSHPMIALPIKKRPVANQVSLILRLSVAAFFLTYKKSTKESWIIRQKKEYL